MDTNTTTENGGGLLLLRHQFGALVATACDFATMIALVQLAGLAPALATATGATVGAIVNFLLGRNWIFASRTRSLAYQAARYGTVSAGSLMLNVLGEQLLCNALGAPYVLARVLVAGAVGIGWNFPLHRHFVFARTASAR